MALERRLQVIPAPSTKGSRVDAALKIGFASTDLKHVDQHFGSASSIAVFAVDQDRHVLVEVLQFGDNLAQDGNEDKLAAKTNALEGCAAIYIQAIGHSAIGKLAQIGVQPVKVSNGSPILEMIDAIQEELREGPTSWLARAIQAQKDPDRFDDMEAEGWDE